MREDASKRGESGGSRPKAGNGDRNADSAAAPSSAVRLDEHVGGSFSRISGELTRGTQARYFLRVRRGDTHIGTTLAEVSHTYLFMCLFVL